MAKPILLVTLYSHERPNQDDFKKIKEQTLDTVNHEYHVLILYKIGVENITIECFNDCKGLPDIDIEKLINELNETKRI